MWRTANSPAYKDKDQWIMDRILPGPVFFGKRKSASTFVDELLFVYFFVGLVAAAPNLPKILAFLLNLTTISVYFVFFWSNN